MLRFVLLTGVSQFRQVSVFSGLNNINDITFNPDYATICGISEQELHDTFDWRVKEFADMLGVEKERIYQELRKRYDGFRFTQAETHVYNPFSLIRCLANKLFENYWFDSGVSSVVATVLPNYWYDFRKLNGPIKAHSSHLKRFVPEEVDPVPILFQTGYLTVDGYDPWENTYTLRFPNEEVKWAFWHGAMPEALGKGNATSYRQELDAMVEHLRAGRVDELMDSLEFLLSTVPYSMVYHNQPTREAQFQLAVFFVFKLAGRDVRAEIPSARGRSDIEVHTEDTVYIFELKVKGAKKGRKATPEEAIAQIKARGYDAPYWGSGKRVVLIGMAFNGRTKRFTWEVEG
ncbi:MAG: hypothetical protein CSA97_05990 [Bacteroidetes bacterium]|nr:MAG: hypothetical protein CSA97_05990 [Bacteroidota bacterium]